MMVQDRVPSKLSQIYQEVNFRHTIISHIILRGPAGKAVCILKTSGPLSSFIFHYIAAQKKTNKKKHDKAVDKDRRTFRGGGHI